MLSDTVNARVQLSDTTYTHIDKRGKPTIRSQIEFARLARKALEEKEVIGKEEAYKPLRNPHFESD